MKRHENIIDKQKEKIDNRNRYTNHSDVGVSRQDFKITVGRGTGTLIQLLAEA